MAQMINTNIMSLNAQRQLNKSQLTQNEAMERLSSGLRINSAKDDAAGLAISTGMQSQIKGINQAVRNSNDGISMAQTAEGSMDEMSNILQRMRELSVQSSNDTNSASNRGAIQKEIDQLHSELDRIASTTEFNGTKILDGSSGTTTLQIGANSGETLSFEIAGVTTNNLGLNGNLNKGDLNSGRVTAATTGAAGEMAINGVDVPKSASGSAVDIAKAINSKTGESGVSASAYNVIQGDLPSDTVTGKTDGMTIQVGNGEIIELGATSSMDNLVETINRDVAGVSASLGDDGELLLTNDTGEDIAIGNGQAAGIVTTDSATLTAVEDAGTVLGDAVTAHEGVQTTYDDAVTAQKAAQTIFDASAKDPAADALLLAANTKFTAAQGVFDTGVETLATAHTTHDTTKKAALDAAPAEVFSGYIALDSADDTAISVTGDAAGKAGFLKSNGAGSITGEKATIGTGVTIEDKLQINGIEIGDFTVDTAAGADTPDEQMLAHINSYSDKTGVTISGSADKGFQFSSKDGSAVEITSGADTQAGRKAALDKLGMSSEMGGKSIDALGINVSTADRASKSIEMIDKALGSISDSRANLGAIQNRLGSTISNLENVSQNLSSANSRIQDADFAAETSKMSKAQILQQAGTSMLSQANASTQNVLSLLQG